MEEALIECSMNNDSKLIIHDKTSAQRFSLEVFNSNIMSFMDIMDSELEENWKTCTLLTVAQGQVRLRHATKRNIHPLIQ